MASRPSISFFINECGRLPYSSANIRNSLEKHNNNHHLFFNPDNRLYLGISCDLNYRKAPYSGILVIFSCRRYGNIE